MVYAIKKFRNYLLANKFVFFMDHHALLYLVNKPCSMARIVRWFVILLEFDFTISIKLGHSHQRADHLSRITNGEAPIGVNDECPIQHCLKWKLLLDGQSISWKFYPLAFLGREKTTLLA